MGSGSSVPKCPSDYSEKKFKTILRLFDDLDADGNFVIDKNDEHSLVFVSKQIVDKEIEMYVNDNAIRKNEMSAAEANKRKIFERELAEWKTTYGKDVRKKDAEIERLRNMGDVERCDYFLKRAGNGNKLTFERFFHFMKHRI